MLTSAAEEADLSTMSSDDVLMMLCLTGCRDEKLLEKLLKEQTPTLALFREITGQHERATVNVKAMRNQSSGSAMAATATTQQQRGNRKKAPNPSPGMSRQDRQKQLRSLGLCQNCAGTYNKEHKCPAQGKACHRCKGSGHFSPACHLPKPENPGAGAGTFGGGGSGGSSNLKAITFQGDEAVSTSGATVAFISCNVAERAVDSATPRMKGTRFRFGKRSLTTNALPDTGATHTIVSASLVEGGEVSKRGKTKIYTANGSELGCLGSIVLRVEYQGNECEVNALVTDGFAGTLIVAWQDLISLAVIHPDFPNILEAMRDGKDREEKVFCASENFFGPHKDYCTF